MWPFKKKQVDVVTIPDVVWARSTSDGIIKTREEEETKFLLKRIGRWIEDYVNDGKVNLRITSYYLEQHYQTPKWILRDNIQNALESSGYEVSRGISSDYYINIKWGETPECHDFEPITKPYPGPRNKVGE